MDTRIISKVKFIVSELDGVVTDATAPITESGATLYKYYCMKDFEAINLIKRNFKFIFLSSDNQVNHNLCNRKNIPFYWAPRDKKRRLVELMQKNGVAPESFMYVGSSFTDIECFNLIPASICPIDAIEAIKSKAFFVCDVPGGFGVLGELYERLLLPEIIRRGRANELLDK